MLVSYPYRGKQTCIDIQGPRFLGVGITRGTVYISMGTGYLTELIVLQGNDGISREFKDEDDKENRSVLKKQKIELVITDCFNFNTYMVMLTHVNINVLLKAIPLKTNWILWKHCKI